MKVMDIVYILGSGSVWQNNEIRYSLRSVEKNISDLGNVFIVGEKPDWIQNVFHIPYPDSFREKWKNGFYKIRRACLEEKISDTFLLMNDDFFIREKIEAENYPYYYNGLLSYSERFHSKRVKTTRAITAERLKYNNRGLLNFSIHRPFRYNKEMFYFLPDIPLSLKGFSVRSFYANYYNIPAVPSKDPLISPLSSGKDFEKIVSGSTDFSIFSSTARSPVFHNWIQSLFPDPSSFERKRRQN
jgi:hypothetical protein